MSFFVFLFLRCREACLQLHEDAKNVLRDQLNQDREQIVRDLKYVSLNVYRYGDEWFCVS